VGVELDRDQWLASQAVITEALTYHNSKMNGARCRALLLAHNYEAKQDLGGMRWGPSFLHVLLEQPDERKAEPQMPEASCAVCGQQFTDDAGEALNCFNCSKPMHLRSKCPVQPAFGETFCSPACALMVEAPPAAQEDEEAQNEE
jgi:hypothetical protein